MAVLQTAVLLFAFPLGQKLALKGDAPWYVKYFFSPSQGHAAFWAKQSDNAVVVDGEVFDWAVVDDAGGINFGDRTQVINSAIAAIENDRGVDFGKFDLVVCVLGVPPSQSTDGGSCTASSKNRKHAGIVTRVGDTFDFVSHEIGHAIGLNHSYGDPKFKSDTWSQPGEYGHPWCIMSARSYGGFGGSYYPASPIDGRSEYTGLGPSVNVATALGRTWVDAASYDLAHAQLLEFDLRSRSWLGHNGQLPPQALEVRAIDGKTYVLEYREATGWDQGQGKSYLIVNAGKGSSGDLAHPNTFSATFVGEIGVPIVFGGPGSVFNGYGFGVEVLDRSADAHTLHIRIRPGRTDVTELDLVLNQHTLSTEVVETGETTWAPGEKLCVEGTWPYRKVARSQEAVLDATYALARAPITAAWTIDGHALAGTNGSVLLKGKQVHVANAKLANQIEARFVSVRYEIEPLATGSRLHLFNNPEDETYSLDVGVTISTAVGSASDEAFARFTGLEYVYPPAFYDEMQKCIDRFKDIAQRYVRYKVVLPPDLWKRVPESEIERVETLVAALGAMRSENDQRGYAQALAELQRVVGREIGELRAVSRDERVEVRMIDAHNDP